jgi:hypothetical protein
MSVVEAEPAEDTINAHTNAAYAATFQNLMQQIHLLQQQNG